MKKITTALLLAAMLAGCSLPKAHKVSPQFAGGIGALMREHDGIEIVKVAQGLPADHAGMKAWDKILEIDGMPTLGLRLPEAVLLLRGPAGSKTTLLVRRVGRSEPQAVILIRKAIDPDMLKWKNDVMITTEDGRRYVEEADAPKKALDASGD
jgi:C-terminal processing protease CtpA/Prc